MHVPTHALLGWLIAQPLPSVRDRRLVTLAAVLPDIDGLAALGGVELYQRHHHTFGHNVFAWGVTVLGACLFAKRKMPTTVLSALGFASHLFTDLLGSGFDWPLHPLWPVSWWQLEFHPPFQWELASWQNYLAALLCFGAMVFLALKRGRSVVEVFGAKAELHFVATLQKWLGRRAP